MRRAAIGSVLILLASCGEERPRDKTAPFQTSIAGVVLRIPQRADLYQATTFNSTIVVKICNRHAIATPVILCEDLLAPIVSEFGLYTIVTAPLTKQFSLLRERPNEAPPQPIPLEIVPEGEIDRNIGGGGEAYSLSRIKMLDRELLTTTNRWPMVSCWTHPTGPRGCRMGFLIKNAFVQAGWFAEAGVALNQAEVWQVASAVDAKLRSLMVEASPQSP